MYLGLDIGTSGVKAVLVDEAQNIVDQATAPLTVNRPQALWSEQNPQDWWEATTAAVKQLDAFKRSGVKAIGLSGQMHGATCLDSADKVIRPAILWNDGRSGAECLGMMAEMPELTRITGNLAMPGFTAPKLEWMRTYEAENFVKVAKVLLPKDYVRLLMTGDYASDMSDSAGTLWMDVAKRDWSDEVLALTALTREHMPKLFEGSEATGNLRKDIATDWGVPSVPVAAGGGDNAASAVGVGVVKAGDALVSLGTSGVLFAASDTYQPNAATAVHTFCHAVPDTWHQMGVILAATDALNWLATLTGQSPSELTRDLGDVTAPSRTLFLPYLGGERTPHNTAQMRGQFLHLDHATDARQATRAVLQGVCYAFADCKDALGATGTQLPRALAMGGGAKSDHWLSMLATTLDIALEVPKAGDFGAALGAARLAMMAGAGAGIDVATQPPLAMTVEPDAALRAAITDGHARYKQAYAVLKDL